LRAPNVFTPSVTAHLISFRDTTYSGLCAVTDSAYSQTAAFSEVEK